MKIMTVIGARPQFVKAAVVSRAIIESNKSEQNSFIEEVIVHTGQHFDANMSDVFFEQMNIPKPHYNLEVNSLTHGAMTGKMLTKIEEVLLNEKPDWVLVYGDTNSTIAGALAAKKLHIKVAHVEAGLRSFNMEMPEEINRILTDRISDILFCPTETAMDNLHKEGYANIEAKKVNCGDVMHDAALFYASSANRPKNVEVDNNFILCTVHRQENTDVKGKLTDIFEALAEIGKQKKVILPLHPRTIKKLEEYNVVPNTNIQILDPVGYFEMLWLLKHCDLVITDSGGLQKEAFFFKNACITLREETEWVELVNSGFNCLTGSNKELILEAFERASQNTLDFNKSFYGKGDTGHLIVDQLIAHDRK